jgi:hypothetical protein
VKNYLKTLNYDFDKVKQRNTFASALHHSASQKGDIDSNIHIHIYLKLCVKFSYYRKLYVEYLALKGYIELFKPCLNADKDLVGFLFSESFMKDVRTN